MRPKLSAASAAANAAALALAATGTPHGRVPKRQAPTPPGLRDLSEAVLWAQTEAFEEAAWARRAAELSDAEALESADAAIERYDARCALLAELFDGVPVSEALSKRKKQGSREGGGGEPFASRSLAETVRALEAQGAPAASSTSATAGAAAASSSAAAAAAAAASSEFEAVLLQLSQARTRGEVSAAEQAYLAFRAKRRRRREKGGGGGGEEQEQAPLAAGAVAAAPKRRTVAPGLFEILLDPQSTVRVPDPPEGTGLEL